jgi:cobalt-zinc-cadmium efflux system membrane fusion protein
MAISGCGQENSGQDMKNGREVSVITANIAPANRSITASGKLESLESASLVSKISGRVARITVDVGSDVKAGDMLVSLDAGELAAAVQLAEANLNKAKNSDLPNLQNAARTTLETSAVSFKNAEADYNRSKTLLTGGAVSRQSFEQLEKAYLTAKSAYESAQKNMDIVNKGTVPETIRLFEAQLAQARANYDNSIINSPIGGVVTARYINPGELAGTSNPVLAVVNLDKVVLRVDVEESIINSLREGSAVDVRVAAVSDKTLKGAITNIALAASPTTKAYQVKIQIPNQGHLLKPGMYAEVILDGRQGEGVSLPREAVLMSGDNQAVWIVSAGTARKREVKTIPLDDKQVLVTSGLNAGESVIVGSIETLKDGTKVSPKEKQK